MRSPKVMRAGTGNKNIILCGLKMNRFLVNQTKALNIMLKITNKNKQSLYKTNKTHTTFTNKNL